jgi:hypothetical protein
LVTLVVTLLGHGWPLQAVGAADGLEERTVADGQQRAGPHAQRFHALRVQQGPVDAQHVQADERSVKRVGHQAGMAMARAVPSRRGRGGGISPHRDGRRRTALGQVVRRCVTTRAILVGVDGLASYGTAFGRGFRHQGPGQRGRPRRVVEPGLVIGPVGQRSSGRRLVGVRRRVVRGSVAAVAAGRARTATGPPINPASIERLHAPLRSCRAALGRRGRALAPEPPRLHAGR